MKIFNRHKIIVIASISITVLIIMGLIVTIAGINTNWSFRDFNFAKIFSKEDKNITTTEALSDSKEDENITTTETLPDLTEEDQNELYTLYLPEYKFHIAYPSYILKADYATGSWSYSRWTLNTDTGYKEDSLGESIYNIDLRFYPFVWTKATDESMDVACGYGCLNEQWVNVSIYNNADSKTLEEVGDLFMAKRHEIATWSEARVQKSSKWGKDVLISQEPSSWEGPDYEGYFVVSGKYIYEISYFLNGPDESQAFAEKIIDSIAFN